MNRSSAWVCYLWVDSSSDEKVLVGHFHVLVIFKKAVRREQKNGFSAGPNAQLYHPFSNRKW